MEIALRLLTEAKRNYGLARMYTMMQNAGVDNGRGYMEYLTTDRSYTLTFAGRSAEDATYEIDTEPPQSVVGIEALLTLVRLIAAT
jgi:hypothetical protein